MVIIHALAGTNEIQTHYIHSSNSLMFIWTFLDWVDEKFVENISSVSMKEKLNLLKKNIYL